MTTRKFNLSRQEQLANIMYPALADDETKRDMATVAKRSGKAAPSGPKLLSHAERGSCSPLGGKAQGEK
jgi:hypothetical protein